MSSYLLDTTLAVRPPEPKFKGRRAKASRAPAAIPARLQLRIETIPVEMEWDEDAAKWVTYVPLLNNISTFGSTQTEALKHTRELILTYVESMVEEGLHLPLTDAEVQSLISALR